MDFYPDSSAIDLRDELHAVLYGRADLVPQGRKVLLRLMTDEYCECYDRLHGSPNPHCAYCQGEGFKFYDSIETMAVFPGVTPLYKAGFLGNGQFPLTPTGFDDPNKSTGFCEYTVFQDDYERFTFRTDKNYSRIYDLKVDAEGETQYPLVKTGKWKIINVTPIYGDFGRVEYFMLALDKQYV